MSSVSNISKCMSLIPSIEDNTIEGVLFDQKIAKEDIKVLAEALKTNWSVRNFFMGYTEIGDEEFKLLSDAFRVNRSITTVVLLEDAITDKGANYLADALTVNHSISHLGLNFKKTTEEGFFSLTNALKKNRTLTSWKDSSNYEKHMRRAYKAMIDLFNENTLIDYSHLLYNQDPNLNKKNKKLKDECHHAVKQGNLDRLKSLLGKGVSLLSTSGQESNTILHWAVLGNDEEMVAYLIQEFETRGPVISSLRNAKNQTPLELAIVLNHQKIAQMLLAVTPWFKNFKSLTVETLPPQLVKIIRGPVRFLIDALSENPHFKDIVSILDQIILSDKSHHTIEQKNTSEERKKDWETVLTKVQKFRNLEKKYKELEKKLRDVPHNKEIEDELKITKNELEKVSHELQEANEKLRLQAEENKKKIEQLEESNNKFKAKISENNQIMDYVRNDMWSNQLYLATQQENEAALETILNQGCRADHLIYGKSLLHLAVEKNSKKLVELLIQRHADPNIPAISSSSETALHCAVTAVEINKSIIKLLIDAGANVTIPMKKAEGKGYQTVIEYVMERMLPFEAVASNLSRKQSSNYVLSDKEEKDLAKAVGALNELREILSILKEAEKYQDSKKILESASASILERYKEIEKCYRTAIDLLQIDPRILRNETFEIYLKALDDEHQATLELLSAVTDQTVRDKFKKEIDAFFAGWKAKLQDADKRMKALLSSPTSMKSSPRRV